MKVLALIMTLIMSFGFSKANAQSSSCKDFLVDANQKYMTGKFEQAIVKIRSCINSDVVSNAEREVGLQLLVRSYVQLNQEEQALEVLNELLLSNPMTKLTGISGGSEVNALLRKFSVKEKLIVGVYGGATNTHQTIIRSFSPIKMTLTNQSLLGVTGGVSCQLMLRNGISFTTQPGLSLSQYRNQVTDEFSKKSVLVEQMNVIELPLDLGYKYRFRFLTVEAFVGAQLKYLNTSFVDFRSIDSREGDFVHRSFETTSYRNRMLGTYRLGIGLSGGVLADGLSFQIYRENVFTNLTNPDLRYQNHDFISATNYIDPDFSLVVWKIQICFNLPIKYYVDKN